MNDGDGSKHAKVCTDRSKSCVRLNIGQKRQVLRLLTQRVSQTEIARRFEISKRGVQNRYKNAEVDGLAQALTAFSVGVLNAGNGSGVQDKEVGRGFVGPPDLPGPASPLGRHRRGS